MNRIYGFNTHYEIYDYNLGDFKELEYNLTFRDRAAFVKKPRYYYEESTKTLFIPRGFSSYKLLDWNGKPITYVKYNKKPFRISFNMVSKPRDEKQEEAIRFLVGILVIKMILKKF